MYRHEQYPDHTMLDEHSSPDSRRPPQLNESNLTQDAMGANGDGSDGDGYYKLCSIRHVEFVAPQAVDPHDEREPHYDWKHTPPTLSSNTDSIPRGDYGEQLHALLVQGGYQPPPQQAAWQNLELLDVRERQLRPFIPGDTTSWAEAAAPSFLRYQVKAPSFPSSLVVDNGSKGSTSSKKSKQKRSSRSGDDPVPQPSRPDDMTSLGAMFDDVACDPAFYGGEIVLDDE